MFRSTRPAVTDRYSATVAASASIAARRSLTARVAAASSSSSTTIGRPSTGSTSSASPRTTRRTWAMRNAQRPPSNVASDGSVWRREAITRAALATASARSAARPSQNIASAARVGTEATRSTCGSGATTGGAARSAPSTHTSFARRAVGRRGSSPSFRTRPLPPAITVTPSGPATACRRITTWARADPALTERRDRRQLRTRLEQREVEADARQPLDRSRPARRRASGPRGHRTRGRSPARRHLPSPRTGARARPSCSWR